MKSLLKYLSKAKVEGRQILTQRSSIFAIGVSVAFRLWIFSQLYRISFNSVGAQTIGGLTYVQVIWCLMFTQSFNMAARPPPERVIEDAVKSGLISYELCRPYSFLWAQLAAFIGRAIPMVVINISLGSIIAYILVGGIELSIVAVLASLVLAFFGYLLDFLISASIGLCALWFEDISAFSWIYGKARMLFGGSIIPLALFPDWLRGTIECLPFGLQLYAPSRTIVGYDNALFQKFILFQLLWILILGLVAQAIFLKGERHVSINGG